MHPVPRADKRVGVNWGHVKGMVQITGDVIIVIDQDWKRLCVAPQWTMLATWWPQEPCQRKLGIWRRRVSVSTKFEESGTCCEVERCADVSVANRGVQITKKNLEMWKLPILKQNPEYVVKTISGCGCSGFIDWNIGEADRQDFNCGDLPPKTGLFFARKGFHIFDHIEQVTEVRHIYIICTISGLDINTWTCGPCSWAVISVRRSGFSVVYTKCTGCT